MSIFDFVVLEGVAREPDMETVDWYTQAWMLNKSWISSGSESSLKDELDVHRFLLFRMHLVDPRRFAGQDIAVWERGTVEYAHQSQSIGNLDRDQSQSQN
eukprot:scaffold51016_cov67-Attheya_sp.AAC.4